MSAATPVRTTKALRRLAEWSSIIFTLITGVYCNADRRNDWKALHVFCTQLLTLPGSTKADDAHPGSELSRDFLGGLGSLKRPQEPVGQGGVCQPHLRADG